MDPLAPLSPHPSPSGDSTAAPRSAAAAASPHSFPTQAPSLALTTCPEVLCPHQNPALTSPNATQRPQLRSIVVGSLELQCEDTSATLPPASQLRKVRFSFTPPPTSNSIESAPATQPHKSCLKYASILDTGCAASSSNGGASSRSCVDKMVHSSDARSRMAMPGLVAPARAEEDEDGWTKVLRKRRPAQVDSNRPATHLPAPRSAIADLLRGKCLRCLAGGHRAAVCREPVRCLRCGRMGHKARECSRRASNRPARGISASRPSASSAPPPPNVSSFPPLLSRTMPALGDPAARPGDTRAVAAASTDMETEATRLSACAVVLGLCRGHGEPEPEEVEKALRAQFGVQKGHVTVSRHRPENFIADFRFPHHRDAAVAFGRLPVGSHEFCLWPWRILPYSYHCDMRYHVRLCLEGIPLHAWNENIAKHVVARACDIDYVEPKSLDRKDTRALCLWAWTYNPSDIPKVTWLTVTSTAVHVHVGTSRPCNRRGLTFRVIVHLDLLEMPPDSRGRVEPRGFTWRYGVIDGEHATHECHVPPPSEPRSGCRCGDDDNKRCGCHEEQRDHRGSCLFRSLSCAPKRTKEREQSDSRHGRRDKTSAPGGQHRHGRHSQSLPCHAFSASTEQHTHSPRSSITPIIHSTETPDTCEGTQAIGPLAGVGEVEDSRSGWTPPGMLAMDSKAADATPHSDDKPGEGCCYTPRIDASNSILLQHTTSPTNALDGRPQASAMEMGFAATTPPAATPRHSPRRPTPEGVNSRPASPTRESELNSHRLEMSTTPRRSPRPGQGMPCGWNRRFRPNCVYVRRFPRGHRTPAPALAQPNVTATFVNSVTLQTVEPLLQEPPQQTVQAKRGRKRALTPMRKSLRIAGTSWPCGDAQAKARQVLMKKLGFKEDVDRSDDDAMLDYFRLFGGPLSDPVIKALTALCGLDGDTSAGCSQA